MHPRLYNYDSSRTRSEIVGIPLLQLMGCSGGLLSEGELYDAGATLPSAYIQALSSPSVVGGENDKQC